MKRIDVYLSVGLVLLSSFYLYHALGLPQGMSRGSPRAGTFPFYLGLLLVGASLVYLAQSVLALGWRRAGGGSVRERPDRTGAMPLGTLVLLAAVTAYVIALYYVGFIAATVVFGIGVLRFYFGSSWLVSVLAPTIITASCYLIFIYGLGLSLPTSRIF